MNVFEQHPKAYLEFCQREYVRNIELLSTQPKAKTHHLIILVTVLLILFWHPMQALVIEEHSSHWRLLGFIFLLIFSLTVVILNFMKQSVALFYRDQIKYYETEIKDLTTPQNNKILSIIKHAAGWMKAFQEPLVTRFYGLFFGFALFFPPLVLSLIEPKHLQYASIYFAFAFIIIGIANHILNTLTRKITILLK